MSYYNLMDAFYSNGCLQPLLDCVRAHCAGRRCLPYVVTSPTHCAGRRCCMPYGDMSPAPVIGVLWVGCLLRQIRFMLLTLVLYSMSTLVYSWLSGWIVYFLLNEKKSNVALHVFHWILLG